MIGNAMDTPHTITIQRTGTPSAAAPAELVIPRQLGSVNLVREIGRGGMGTVWLGHDRLLGRDVAVKFLLNAVSGDDDPGFVRFVEGARAAAAVRHVALTQIHTADVVQGVPYLVMEFIDGPTLSDLLRQHGRLSVGATLGTLDYVCTAVGELHERGVVHRDIKPGNILLDADGRAFITDFGLACARSTAGSTVLAGTPAYMAPEMFDGSVSPRSDVYAIAVMTYQLLTSELPFRGDATDISTLQRSVPLPLDPLRRQRIEPGLIDVLERAAHKDAKFRYKSAQHLLRAMQAVYPDAAHWSAGRRELAALVSRAMSAPPTIEPASVGSTSSYYDRLATMAAGRRGSSAGVAPPAVIVQPVPAPAVPVIATDLSCAQCGYNLRSLQPMAQCPECGALVAESLRPDRLLFASPRWLKRIALGTALLFWAGVAVVLLIPWMLLVPITLAPPTGVRKLFIVLFDVQGGVSGAAFVASPLLWVLGVWFCTARERPRCPPERLASPRRRARAASVLLLAVGMAALIGVSGMRGALAPIAMGVLLFAMASDAQLHLAGLARRIPDPALARRRYVPLILGALWATFVLIVLLTQPEPAPAVPVAVLEQTILGATLIAAGLLLTSFAWLMRPYRRALRRVIGACVPYDQHLTGNLTTQASASQMSSYERVEPSTPVLVLPAALPADGDLPCTQCGYNLRGLAPDGRCPECGAEVSRSYGGDLLKHANRDWLRKVKRGIDLLVWSLIVLLALGLLGGCFGAYAGATRTRISSGAISAAIQFVSATLLVAAAFLISSQEPRITLTEPQFSWRKLIRIAAILGASAQMAAAIAQLKMWPHVAIAMTALLIASEPTKYFASFSYLRSFAVRIPDPRLAHSTNIVKWGLSITALLGAVTAVLVLTKLPGLMAAATGASATATQPVGAPNVTFRSFSTPVLAVAAGLSGCAVGVSSLVFQVWAFVLLWQYRRVFAATLAGSNAADMGISLIPSRNPAALWAYYLGIFSFIPVVGLALGIAAFIFGLKGLAAQRRDPSVRGGVHAWIGVLAGALFVLAHVVLGVVVLVAWWQS
jgi:Zn finger protein HypA/HybF involved in hydrogenase expression